MDRPFARIACCVDRDEMAPRVLEEGLRLAGGDGARLQVVHVIAPPTGLAAPFVSLAPVMEATSAAEDWLCELTADTPGVTTVMLDGAPARTICAWALEHDVDLIVSAAFRGMIERAMVGGFASHVAYHAPCSVLLIHPPIDEAVPASGAVAAAER